MTIDHELKLLRKLEALAFECGRLRAERDTWRARAFAMFWKLPGDLTLAELQSDTERARAFFPLESDAPETSATESNPPGEVKVQ